MTGKGGVSLQSREQMEKEIQSLHEEAINNGSRIYRATNAINEMLLKSPNDLRLLRLLRILTARERYE